MRNWHRVRVQSFSTLAVLAQVCGDFEEDSLCAASGLGLKSLGKRRLLIGQL
jgi:hypothetical protein